MAFPSVRSESTGVQNSDASSWTAVTYPATIVAGDLLVLTIGNDGASTVAAPGFAVSKTLVNGTACRISTLTRVAAGTETGTFTVTLTGGAEQGAWRCVAYQSWHGTVSGGVEFSTGATGTATTPSTNMPDPDALTPSWGAADTFWQAISAADDGRTSFSGFPTNYNTSQFSDASGGPSGAAMGSASRQLNATSDNPSVFTISRSVAWAAFTMAIRPGAAGTPHTRTPSSSLALTDARALARMKAQADPLSLADNAARALEYARSAADSLALADNADPQLTPGGGGGPDPMPREIILTL